MEVFERPVSLESEGARHVWLRPLWCTSNWWCSMYLYAVAWSSTKMDIHWYKSCTRLGERDVQSRVLTASSMIFVSNSEYVVVIISINSCKIVLFILDFTVYMNSRYTWEINNELICSDVLWVLVSTFSVSLICVFHFVDVFYRFL